MKINIQKNISNKYKDLDITINAPEDAKYIDQIENLIIQILNSKQHIIGVKDNKNYILKTSQIISFYSESKYNYCKTMNKVFKIKERLYELENELGNDFVRISNSCIINLNYIKVFNSNITGTIEVILENGEKEYVSRRKVKAVLKKIIDWRNFK